MDDKENEREGEGEKEIKNAYIHIMNINNNNSNAVQHKNGYFGMIGIGIPITEQLTRVK